MTHTTQLTLPWCLMVNGKNLPFFFFFFNSLCSTLQYVGAATMLCSPVGSSCQLTPLLLKVAEFLFLFFFFCVSIVRASIVVPEVEQL